MKRILQSTVILVLCVAFLAACSGVDKDLAGNYVNVYNGEPAFVLNEDGTFRQAFADGKWKTSGKTVTLTFSDGEEKVYTSFENYLVPEKYTIQGSSIPAEGLFNGTFEGKYELYDFLDDGTFVRTVTSSGEEQNGTYEHEGDFLTLTYGADGLEVSFLIYDGGLNDSAVVKVED